MQNLRKFIEGKKYEAKSFHQASYSMMQIKERFESMSFKTARFFNKLYRQFFHTLETFYLSSFFYFILKTLAFSYLKMYREPMK